MKLFDSTAQQEQAQQSQPPSTWCGDAKCDDHGGMNGDVLLPTMVADSKTPTSTSEHDGEALHGSDIDMMKVSEQDDLVAAADDEKKKENTTTNTTSRTTKSSGNVLVDCVRKGAVAVTGGTMTVVGLIMIPLPTPMGCVVAAAGMALLGTEFDAANRILDRAQESAVALRDKWMARDKIMETVNTTTTTTITDASCDLLQQVQQDHDTAAVLNPATPESTLG